MIGKPWSSTLLGYRNVNGKYEVVPEEAETVRMIFDWYLEGMGATAIRDRLNAMGIKTRLGNRWSRSPILKLLRNYAYTGNLLLQRTYREDHITKKCIINHGEKPMYHATGTHEAIIDMDTFNRVHGDMIKTLYAASATSSYHTAVYGDGWEYDISKINIPVFLTAGTGNWDAGTATGKDQVNDDKNGIAQGICPLWSLQENYNLLPETIDKVIARKKNVDHGDSYLQFDGYMTAWFMWQLQGDEEAAKAFVGENPEIMNNGLYQDQKINIEAE